MKFTEFFETAKALLSDSHSSRVALLLADYCKLLEQFMFEHAYILSEYQKEQVYGNLLNFLQSLDLEKFKISCKSLNSQSKLLILRNLDIVSILFPECNLSKVTKLLN